MRTFVGLTGKPLRLEYRITKRTKKSLAETSWRDLTSNTLARSY